MKAAQQVMEQCYSVNGFQYPDITNTSNTIAAICPAPNTSITFSISDPINTGTYIYSITESTPVGSTYTITDLTWKHQHQLLCQQPAII